MEVGLQFIFQNTHDGMSDADMMRKETEIALLAEEVGMDFLHPEALEILSRGGADVTPGSERVRLDRGLIKQALASAPASFTLHARNPARNLTMGGRSLNFCSVASAPNVADIAGGRRPRGTALSAPAARSARTA